MTQEFHTSTRTTIMYSLNSLGVATLAEALSGIIAFYLWLYPLHGRYLQEIKETLKNKRGER